MKNKSKSNKIKLKVPIIINNEIEDGSPKLLRPAPRNLNEINKSSNKANKDNNFRSSENKTYASEGSCTNSK